MSLNVYTVSAGERGGEIVERGGERPAWLLHLTNDAWFGVSAGPWQHLAQARARAIEQGLPLLRAANTGISAVIDPWGRILESRGIGVRGMILARPPSPTAPTPYALWGETIFLGMAGLCLLAGFGWRRRAAPEPRRARGT